MRLTRLANIVLAVPLAAVVLAGCATRVSSTRTLELSNSDFLASDSPRHELMIWSDESGEPIAYAMDVRSVYCLDARCEIISVRLYWDALGAFDRYEVPPGRNLTKNEHEVFSQRDHRKLRELLSDPHSPAGAVTPAQLLEAEREQAGETDSDRVFAWRNPEYAPGKADAASTPTPIDLRPLLVDGAAYTSLTLWHWANGEVSDHIRSLTRDSATRRQLLGWLADPIPDHARFALEALTHRRVFDPVTRDAVIDRFVGQTGDGLLIAWPYLDQSADDAATRLELYETLFDRATSSERVALIERLAQERTLDGSWIERLAPVVSRMDTYYQVDLFLGLVSERKIDSAEVDDAVRALADHSDPFIARRAKRYLGNRGE